MRSEGRPMAAVVMWFAVAVLCGSFVRLAASVDVETGARPSHICDVTKQVTETRSAKCGEFLQQIIDGFSPDLTAFSDVDDKQIQVKFVEWSDKPEKSPDCNFFKVSTVTVQGCCEGWTGDSCQKPICQPACEHNGVCSEPHKCTCKEPYNGVSCTENKLAITRDKQYCYLTSSCSAELVNGTSLVSKSDCCSKLGGFGWGIFGGSCQPCPRATSPDESAEYNLDTPYVIPNPNNIPLRTCVGRGPNYFRTSDGVEFCFADQCATTVYSDSSRSVVVKPINCQSYITCKKLLTITLNNNDVVSALGDEISVNGRPVVLTNTNGFATGGIRMELRGEYFYLEYGSLHVRWDNGSTWFITIGDSHHVASYLKIKGLCGNFDGITNNDLQKANGEVTQDPTAFGNSWKDFDGGSKCPDAPKCTFQCTSKTLQDRATKACALLNKAPFSACHDTISPKHYFLQCVNNWCAANSHSHSFAGDEALNKREVAEALCETLDTYSQICASQSVPLTWRSPTLCPHTCPAGMDYLECLPKFIRTCSNLYAIKVDEAGIHEECYPGCQCRSGTFLHAGICVEATACPCQYQGKYHDVGSIVAIGCNKCTCELGKWKCTDDSCARTCSVLGYQHIETFDGKKYDFEGPACEYTLVELNDEAKKSPVFTSKGSVTISYKVTKCLQNSVMSCTDFVTIKYKRDNRELTVEIDHAFAVKVNGTVLPDTRLHPYANKYVLIKRVTSLFITVSGFGFSLIYDKNGRIYVTLDPFYSDHVRGLCGNMDGSVDNDLISRQGIEEQTVSFAMSYSTCEKLIGQATASPDPCGFNSGASQFADEACRRVGENSLFQSCQKKIPAWTRYRDYCKKDSCANTGSHVPVCTMIAALAHECAQNGETVDWLADSDMHTYCQGVEGYSGPPGSIFSQCVPHQQSCSDIQWESTALAAETGDYEECLEGSYCGQDYLVDETGKLCVPIDKCPCYDDISGTYKLPGTTTRRSCTDCVCTKGDWDCGDAECSKVIKCPENQVYRQDIRQCGSSCDSYDTCTGTEPVVEGCGCPDGTVLYSTENNTCVEVDQCPCVYNQVYYPPHAEVTVGCKVYHCEARRWTVYHSNDCKGICSAFGDPHYLTFDGYRFGYQGSCEFVFVRNKEGQFIVTSENVPCGSTGVTCTRAIEITVGNTHVSLVQGRDPLVNNQTVGFQEEYFFEGGKIEGTGIFVSVYFDIGLVVLWDGGTRLYVLLSAEYMGQVEGLCGDFDGDYSNDFKDLSSGQIATTANDFAQIWKVYQTCPNPTLSDDYNPCEVNEQRSDWAKSQCRIIRDGDIFAECRKKITTFEDYYKDCLYDSCGCDKGGDCECLCTAVAAFALQCNRNGVYPKWRSQHFCPVMCDDGRQYQPCASPCKQSCKNVGTRLEKECREELCLEGCFCPPGMLEGPDGRCVFIDQCPCYSDDQILPAGASAELNCQTCYCVNATLQCQGVACREQCGEHEFQCKSDKTCIAARFRCDRMVDCKDGSDERDCLYECPADMFTCVRGDECILLTQVCDGIRQCADGSDEDGPDCTTQCNDEHFFQCDDHVCISRQFVCDGKNDCGPGDNSDERNCTYCKANEFRCDSGVCLDETVRCDGHDQCGDGSDERHCVCEGNVLTVDCNNHDFDLIPSSLRDRIMANCPTVNPPARLPTDNPRVTVTLSPTVLRARFVSVTLWTSNAGRVLLTLHDVTDVYPADKGQRSGDQPDTDLTDQWVSKSKEATNATVAVEFKIEVVAWHYSQVDLQFFPVDSSQPITVKDLSLGVCYQTEEISPIKLTTTLSFDRLTTPYPVPGAHCPAGEFQNQVDYSHKQGFEFHASGVKGDTTQALSGSGETLSINDKSPVLYATRSESPKTFGYMTLRCTVLNVQQANLTVYDEDFQPLVQHSVSPSHPLDWTDLSFPIHGEAIAAFKVDLTFVKSDEYLDVLVRDLEMEVCLPALPVVPTTPVYGHTTTPYPAVRLCDGEPLTLDFASRRQFDVVISVVDSDTGKPLCYDNSTDIALKGSDKERLTIEHPPVNLTFKLKVGGNCKAWVVVDFSVKVIGVTRFATRIGHDFVPDSKVYPSTAVLVIHSPPNPNGCLTDEIEISLTAGQHSYNVSIFDFEAHLCCIPENKLRTTVHPGHTTRHHPRRTGVPRSTSIYTGPTPIYTGPVYTGPTPIYTGPIYTGPTPVYPGPTPIYTGPTPTYTGSTPTFTGPSPIFTGPTPTFTGPIPIYTGPTPIYTGPTPINTGKTPTYTGRTPVYTGPTPLATGPTFTEKAPRHTLKPRPHQCTSGFDVVDFRADIKTDVSVQTIPGTPSVPARDALKGSPAGKFEIAVAKSNKVTLHFQVLEVCSKWQFTGFDLYVSGVSTYVVKLSGVASPTRTLKDDTGEIKSKPAIIKYFQDSFSIELTSGREGKIEIKDMTVQLCCAELEIVPSPGQTTPVYTGPETHTYPQPITQGHRTHKTKKPYPHGSTTIYVPPETHTYPGQTTPVYTGPETHTYPQPTTQGHRTHKTKKPYPHGSSTVFVRPGHTYPVHTTGISVGPYSTFARGRTTELYPPGETRPVPSATEATPYGHPTTTPYEHHRRSTHRGPSTRPYLGETHRPHHTTAIYPGEKSTTGGGSIPLSTPWHIYSTRPSGFEAYSCKGYPRPVTYGTSLNIRVNVTFDHSLSREVSATEALVGSPTGGFEADIPPGSDLELLFRVYDECPNWRLSGFTVFLDGFEKYQVKLNGVASPPNVVPGGSGYISSKSAITQHFKDSFTIELTVGASGHIAVRDLTIGLCCSETGPETPEYPAPTTTIYRRPPTVIYPHPTGVPIIYPGSTPIYPPYPPGSTNVYPGPVTTGYPGWSTPRPPPGKFCVVTRNDYIHLVGSIPVDRSVFGWTDTGGDQQPISDDELVYFGDKVPVRETVRLSRCRFCQCGLDGNFVCHNENKNWTSADHHCVLHFCERGVEITVDRSTTCECAANERAVPGDGKRCCECVPLEHPPVPGCQLHKTVQQLVVFDDQRTQCVSIGNVTLTECRGSCESHDANPVRFTDRRQLYTKQNKDCNCCSGEGKWVEYDVLCGGDTKRSVEVKLYDVCSCQACVESGQKRR